MACHGVCHHLAIATEQRNQRIVCWTMIFCSDWARKSIDADQIAMLGDQISVKMLRLSTEIIEKRKICAEFIATIRN